MRRLARPAMVLRFDELWTHRGLGKPLDDERRAQEPRPIQNGLSKRGGGPGRAPARRPKPVSDFSSTATALRVNSSLAFAWPRPSRRYSVPGPFERPKGRTPSATALVTRKVSRCVPVASGGPPSRATPTPSTPNVRWSVRPLARPKRPEGPLVVRSRGASGKIRAIPTPTPSSAVPPPKALGRWWRACRRRPALPETAVGRGPTGRVRPALSRSCSDPRSCRSSPGGTAA